MKRFARRTLAVIIGAGLGLYCAGLYNESRERSAMAQTDHVAPAEHAAAEHAPAPEAPAADTHEPAAAPAEHKADHAAAAEHGEKHSGADHGAAASAAAQQLVPAPSQVEWYRPVVFTAIGLFVAAIVLGATALKIRGPLPPDPADSHDDHAHDDHAHDAHGQDHKADDKGHGHH